MVSLFLVVLLAALVTIAMGLAIGNRSAISEDERKEASKALYEAELALMLSLEANLGLEITHHRKKRATTSNLARRWPKGIIPFAFHESLDEYRKQLVNDATAHITQMTKGCIKFVPRTNEGYWLHIFFGHGCSSFVGTTMNGAQWLSLGRGCEYFGTVVHELMHAIGFYHEHQRLDRDQYLYVNYVNIQKEFISEFDVIGDGKMFTRFDFDSIMMYGPATFSVKERPTLIAKDGRSFNDPFDKTSMSTSDAEQIVRFYDDQCNTNFSG